MEFKLHTFDIQHLILSVIVAQGQTGCEESDRQRILSMLTALNTLCTKENDYTLNVTIEA